MHWFYVPDIQLFTNVLWSNCDGWRCRCLWWIAFLFQSTIFSYCRNPFPYLFVLCLKLFMFSVNPLFGFLIGCFHKRWWIVMILVYCDFCLAFISRCPLVLSAFSALKFIFCFFSGFSYPLHRFCSYFKLCWNLIFFVMCLPVKPSKSQKICHCSVNFFEPFFQYFVCLWLWAGYFLKWAFLFHIW